jgi:hypothetical protein
MQAEKWNFSDFLQRITGVYYESGFTDGSLQTETKGKNCISYMDAHAHCCSGGVILLSLWGSATPRSRS